MYTSYRGTAGKALEACGSCTTPKSYVVCDLSSLAAG